MTVRELVELLGTFPQDAEVQLIDADTSLVLPLRVTAGHPDRDASDGTPENVVCIWGTYIDLDLD